MSAFASRRRLGGWRLATTGLLLAGVAALVAGTIVDPQHTMGWDFRGAYLPAAEAIVHGRSPYLAATSPAGRYVYPPQLALALVPFTVLPHGLSIPVAVLLSASLVAAALAVLGIRDLRVYAAVFLWAPTWNELDTASVSAALVLALALAWRYRDSALRCGSALGLAIPAKIFLWPLVVWLVATRRLRALGVSLLLGLGLTALAWAAIGFDGLTSYPGMLRALERAEAPHSYSLTAIATSFGLPAGLGRALVLLAVGALLIGCVACTRRGDDLRAFTFSIAAALAVTPIMWEHFLLVLLVPLAVARPGFSPIWLLPIALWITPRATSDPVEKVLPVLVGAVLVAVVVGPVRHRLRASGTSPAASQGLDDAAPVGREVPA